MSYSQVDIIRLEIPHLTQKVVEFEIEKATLMNKWSSCQGYLAMLVDFQKDSFQAAIPVPSHLTL